MLEFIVGFYFARSVSSAGGTESVFSNPAGLSTYYSGLLLSYNLKDSTYLMGSSFKNLGVFWNGNSTTWILSFGFRGVNVGFLYNDVEHKLKTGFLLRPHPALSLGYYDRILSATLRPLMNSTLELSADVGYDSTFYLSSLSAGINLKNLMLYGKYEPSSKTISAGVNIAYGKVMAGGTSDGNLMLAMGDEDFPSAIKPPKYAQAKITDYLEDIPKINFMSPTQDNFYRVMEKLEKTASDPSVKGILFDISGYGLDMAQTEELRNLVEQMRRNGKKIIFYSEYYDPIRYYLASAGDRIILARPLGGITFSGIYMENFYFKELIDSLGLVVHAEHFEEYKSAVEPFTRTKASKYDREQRERILKVIYSRVKEKIAEGRNIGNIDSLFASGMMITPDVALKMGLVDTLLYEKDLKDYAKKFFETGKRINALVERKEVSYEWEKFNRPRIALVFAEGTIINDDIYNPFRKNITIGKNLAKLLRKLKKDRRIKAVILRVNSPGGSAMTSDLIAREIKELAKDKLVIVSMGHLAASGGYYISAYADTILADRFTLTGSIGILGLIPKTEKFLKKEFKINTDRFIPYPHADLPSTRPMDSVELSAFREFLKYGYFVFLNTVSQGRGMPLDSVRKIAKGRVWIGEDAVKIGIVDKIGGILDAVKMAKEKYPDAEVVIYTRKFKGDYNPLPFGILSHLLESQILYWDNLSPIGKSTSEEINPLRMGE